MLLGRIVGTVVATRKDPRLEGKKLLICRLVDPDGKDEKGYIIAVDKSQNNRRKLYGQIVVAAHKEQGLIVSRLQRFDGTEVLVPENREHDSIAISSSNLRIVAKILWWIGRATGSR